MNGRRWYCADALMADLTNHHHHLRAASEEEVERRMREPERDSTTFENTQHRKPNFREDLMPEDWFPGLGRSGNPHTRR